MDEWLTFLTSLHKVKIPRFLGVPYQDPVVNVDPMIQWLSDRNILIVPGVRPAVLPELFVVYFTNHHYTFYFNRADLALMFKLKFS